MEPTVSTYRVTLTSDLLTGPFVVELIATDEQIAARRVTVGAMHLFRRVELLDAHTDVQLLHAGTCRAAGHDRGQCPA